MDKETFLPTVNRVCKELALGPNGVDHRARSNQTGTMKQLPMYRSSDTLMGFILGVKYAEFQTENTTAVKKFPSRFNF
jgi:hypothetical protein